MDVTSVGAAMSSLKAAGDIAKAMIGLGLGEAAQAKVIELQFAIMDAQQAVFAVNAERTLLVERVDGLEQEIERAKNWDVEKQRYELKELAVGVFAYALKPGEADPEPLHHLCQRRYEDAKKSILQGQPLEKHAGVERKTCPRCGHTLEYWRRDLPAKPKPRHRPPQG